jgi:Phage related hypothetical protein (DUF1799)
VVDPRRFAPCVSELRQRNPDEGKNLREAARLWARGLLAFESDPDEVAQANDETNKALKFFGLVPDRPPVPELPLYWLWPDSWVVFELYRVRLRTQWRVGSSGGVGLDYEEVRRVVTEIHSPSRRRSAALRREELLADLRSVEAGCLQGWREKREERDREEAARRSAHQR